MNRKIKIPSIIKISAINTKTGLINVEQSNLTSVIKFLIITEVFFFSMKLIIFKKIITK